MKNIILVKCIGDQSKYGIGIPIVKDYCEKYGLGFGLINDYKINYKSKNTYYRINCIGFETLQVFDYLEEYDKALVIGGDVLITPNCPNIFNVYNDPDTLYGFHENGTCEHCDRDSNINNMLVDYGAPFVKWPLGPNGKRMYFNADILMFSQKHKKYFESANELNYKLQSALMNEQDVFNFIIGISNMKSESIDYSWNRMDLGKPDPENLRLNANFIHYAGMGYDYENIGRFEIMKKDIRTLYGDKYLQ